MPTRSLPFERLVDALQPARDQARNPLVQSMFTFDVGERTRFELAGLEVRALPVPAPTVKFDLCLRLEERDDGALDAKLEYATALFEAPR